MQPGLAQHSDVSAALVLLLQAEAEAALGLREAAVISLEGSLHRSPSQAAALAWLLLAPLPDPEQPSALGPWLQQCLALLQRGRGELLLRLVEHRLAAQPVRTLRQALWQRLDAAIVAPLRRADPALQRQWRQLRQRLL